APAAGRAVPQVAVAGKIRPASEPGRNGFLNGKTYANSLAADASPCRGTKQRKAPEIPRQPGGRSRREVSSKRDEEERLAPESVGQPAEKERTKNRPAEIGTAG